MNKTTSCSRYFTQNIFNKLSNSQIIFVTVEIMYIDLASLLDTGRIVTNRKKLKLQDDCKTNRYFDTSAT